MTLSNATLLPGSMHRPGPPVHRINSTLLCCTKTPNLKQKSRIACCTSLYLAIHRELLQLLSLSIAPFLRVCRCVSGVSCVAKTCIPRTLFLSSIKVWEFRVSPRPLFSRPCGREGGDGLAPLLSFSRAKSVHKDTQAHKKITKGQSV